MPEETTIINNHTEGGEQNNTIYKTLKTKLKQPKQTKYQVLI